MLKAVQISQPARFIGDDYVDYELAFTILNSCKLWFEKAPAASPLLGLVVWESMDQEPA